MGPAYGPRSAYRSQLYHPTSGKYRQWQQLTVLIVRELWKHQPYAGPVRLNVDFIWRRPHDLCRKADPDGYLLRHIGEDVDNVTKAVMDAINEAIAGGVTDAGVWVDDRQVVDQHSRKWYAPKDHKGGRVDVTITAACMDWTTKYGIPFDTATPSMTPEGTF